MDQNNGSGCLGVILLIIFPPAGIIYVIYLLAQNYRNNAASKRANDGDHSTINDSQTSLNDRLNHLDLLYKNGLITAEEYEAKRKNILDL